MGRRNADVGTNGRLPWPMIRALAASALAVTIGGAMVCEAISEARAEGTLPDHLMYLRDVDPSIIQDMRYAGSNNFVGPPLDGYGAAECILRRDVAAALA